MVLARRGTVGPLELSSDCADAATLSAVAAYLPRGLISRLHAGQAEAPEKQQCQAALAFVDVSGFTKLSAALEKEHGAEGAEKLQQFINSYFDRCAVRAQGWTRPHVHEAHGTAQVDPLGARARRRHPQVCG